MKHIFLVGSNITFYMALSVQKHLKIKEEDMVLLTMQDYKILGHEKHSTTKKIVSLDEEEPTEKLHAGFYWTFDTVYKLTELHKALRASYVSIPKIIRGYFKYKRFVSSKIVPKNTPYVVYAGVFCWLIIRFLASSPNCQEACLLEEGTLSYKEEVLSSRSRIALYFEGAFKNRHKKHLMKGGHFFRHFFRIISVPPKTPIRSFTLSPDGFSNAKVFDRKVIPFYADTNLDLTHIPDKATVFFGESTFEDYFITKDKFFERLRVAIKEIPAKKVYLKFHHKNTPLTQERTQQVFREAGKEVEVIELNVSPEQMFLQKKELKVYGLRSSCLVYAGIFNLKNVFSLEDFFLEIYRNKQDLLGNNSVRVLLERYATFLKPPATL